MPIKSSHTLQESKFKKVFNLTVGTPELTICFSTKTQRKARKKKKSEKNPIPCDFCAWNRCQKIRVFPQCRQEFHADNPRLTAAARSQPTLLSKQAILAEKDRICTIPHSVFPICSISFRKKHFRQWTSNSLGVNFGPLPLIFLICQGNWGEICLWKKNP